MRLFGVLTPAEKRLAREPDGTRLIKEVRLRLMESSKETLERLVSDGSLDVIELVVAFEDEFGITTPDEDMEELETVGRVIDYLTRSLARETTRWLTRYGN